MNAKRITALVAAALVMGLVAGNVASSFAATAVPGNTQTSTGLRLGGAMRDSGGRLLDVVAKLTGTSTEAVVAERQSGKTFTQIAAAKNIKSSEVVAEALKVRTTVLAEKVKTGAITQAQADAAAANMKTRLTTRVDSVNTACDGTASGSGAGGGQGGGRGMGGGQGGGRGMGGGGTCTVTQ